MTQVAWMQSIALFLSLGAIVASVHQAVKTSKLYWGVVVGVGIISAMITHDLIDTIKIMIGG